MEVRIFVGGLRIGRWMVKVNKMCPLPQQHKELLTPQSSCYILGCRPTVLHISGCVHLKPSVTIGHTHIVLVFLFL